MDEQVLIWATKQSNLLKAIVDDMETEKIDYIVENKIEKLENGKKIIYIDDAHQDVPQVLTDQNVSMVYISNEKKVMDSKATINYIITNLIDDKTEYTDVQNEYLQKKGIYRIFLDKLSELLENENGYDGLIYDLTAIKPIPHHWIFHFDSINETYDWLLKKNKMLPDHFVRKVINFYNDKVYDDSLREINYLTQKLKEIKEGKSVIDIFICTKEELEIWKDNYFFKLLLQNISLTYKLYLVDKSKMLLNDKALMEKQLDGIAIYNDCVYRDTYDDEFSLGYVDCNAATIEEYNQSFDYILTQYGMEIKSESDLDEF